MEWKAAELPLPMEQRLEKLAYLGEGFRRRRNPLYVWEAIAMCHEPDHPSIPLPEWCVAYLIDVSSRLLTLAILRDPKTHPPPQPGESRAAAWARIEPWLARQLRPAQALARVPWALDFSRPGWNAFQERSREIDEISAAFLDGAFKSVGQSGWIYNLMRMWGVDYETAEKRVKRGRRLAMSNKRGPKRPPA